MTGLKAGQTYTMPGETLGYEWDSDLDNGFRPAGEIDMSQTCENVEQLLLTPNEQIGPGNACNSLTLYRAASGALVFDAGTVQWAWGLESNHDGDSNNPPDPAMQQATVNLLADMGVQPATLESDLQPATASTDITPPTSTITAPSAGGTLPNGNTVTISGTATDSGGGVVAGVEASTDGGSTWHPVTTMSPASLSVTWSYSWSAAGNGSVTIKSRATDDSANTETPGSGVTVTVKCPCSLFGAAFTPSITSANDLSAYELGVKFQSSVPGWIAGIRFYKGTGNNGTHTGSLWNASGTLLATGTFTNETASGWQTMTFTNPVQISAKTTYVAGYYDPDGHYAMDQDLFDWPLNTPPLSAVQANYLTTGGGNGVYSPGGPNFPTTMDSGTSYGVDVIFDTTQPPGAPPTVSAVTPYAGSSSDPVTTAPTATFAAPVEPGTVSVTMTDPTGNAVAGTTSLNSADTVATFTPTSQLAAGETYTVTFSGAQDQWGQKMTPDAYTFTTSQSFPPGCPCTVWPDTTPAGASDSQDGSSIELGMTFTPSVNGNVTGIRFFKLPDNTGTHTGTLWTSSGTKLATGTFTNESTEGWEQLNFSTPVAVTAGTTYVASYHSPLGNYSATASGLASAVTSGPLTADVGGGVYAYSSATTFPTKSYHNSNYWVDVVFANPAYAPPAVVSSTPSGGATSVPVSAAATINLNEPIVAGSATVTLSDPNGNAVPGTTTLNSSGTTLTFTPSSQLNASTQYKMSVSGATSDNGTVMTSPYSWSFTTSGVAACPCSIFESDAIPSVVTENDPSAVNLGVKFTTSVNGYITGIRFYKASSNTGTHIGSLWDSVGDLLGRVTFTNETATGWQTELFSTPIPVTAGTTYIASYFAPKGDYSDNPAAFANAPTTNSPLQALQSSGGGASGNGLYSYGSSAAFPTHSYNATNYWVDVLFTTTGS